MKFVGFDIEIAKLVPDGEDWHNHVPLGITCASLVSDDLVSAYWAGMASGEYLPSMTGFELDGMINHMVELTDDGYTIVTWNGLGFDFPVLESDFAPGSTICKTLAAGHVDMMFQFLCMRGFPVGLDTVAKTMGLPGKPEGMHGDLAPVMWANGEYQKVIDYVIQDSRSTLDVANLTTKMHGLMWTTKQNFRKSVYIKEWLPVSKCLELPEPDQSWMTKPLKRKDLAGWLES